MVSENKRSKQVMAKTGLMAFRSAIGDCNQLIAWKQEPLETIKYVEENRIKSILILRGGYNYVRPDDINLK